MTSLPRILFVLNPTSGTRSRLDATQLIRSHVDAVRFAADIVSTEYAGHATSLARQAARDGYQVVAAVGGDGTVNEVARGVLGTRTALAIVPRGSGNGLARHLGVPLSIRRSLEVIQQMHVSSIDSGTINGHPFFCTAGLGFDAHISAAFATSTRRGLGAYVALIFREFQQYQPRKLTLFFNGRTLERECFVLAFGNASQYGNNAHITPMADIRDGLLDLCLIPRLSMPAAFQTGIRLLTKQMASSRQATYYQADYVQVKVSENVMFHADGEYVGEAPEFEVKVFPLSLNVLVPA